MQLTCIHCAQPLHVPEDSSDTMTRCGHCGLMVPVLQLGLDTPTPADRPLPPEPLLDALPGDVEQPETPPAQAPLPPVPSTTSEPVLDVVLVESEEVVRIAPLPLPEVGDENRPTSLDDSPRGLGPERVEAFSGMNPIDHFRAEKQRTRQQSAYSRRIVALVTGTMLGMVIGAAGGATAFAVDAGPELESAEIFGRSLIGALAGVLLGGVWFAIIGGIWAGWLAGVPGLQRLVLAISAGGALAGATFGAAITSVSFHDLSLLAAGGAFLGTLAGALIGGGGSYCLLPPRGRPANPSPPEPPAPLPEQLALEPVGAPANQPLSEAAAIEEPPTTG